MTELIQVGDRIRNQEKEGVAVTRVDCGLHGVLVQGTLDGSELDFRAYLPNELPAGERISPWYGWGGRVSIYLPNGFSVGCVCFERGDTRRRIIEEYDAEWERTLASWTPEPMGCIPLEDIQNGSRRVESPGD